VRTCLDDQTLSRNLSLRAARQHAGGQSGAQEILDTLHELLDVGHASLVLALAERALALLIRASEQMDDSAGVVGDAASGVHTLPTAV
jgi:hypothetical protein